MRIYIAALALLCQITFAGEFENIKVPYGNATLAISNDIIYAGLSNGVSKSTDNGLTWLNLPNVDFSFVYDIQVSAQNNQLIYLVSQSTTIYRSQDGGDSFEALVKPDFNNFQNFSQLIISQQNDQRLFALDLVNQKLVKTNNAGLDWVKTPLPTTSPSLKFEIHPTNDEQLYLFNTLASSAEFWTSTDGGLQWQHHNLRDQWEFIFQANLIDYAIHPEDANVIYITDTANVYLVNPDDTLTNTNAINDELTDIEFLDNNRLIGFNHLDIATDFLDTTVKIHTIGENTWENTTTPNGYFYNGIDIFRSDGKIQIWLSKGGHGIELSDDVGQSWNKRDQGIFSPHIKNLFIDPNNEKRIIVNLIREGQGHAFYESLNSGQQWSPIFNKTDQTIVDFKPIDNSQNSYLLYGYSTLFKTINSGETIEEIDLNLVIDTNGQTNSYTVTMEEILLAPENGEYLAVASYTDKAYAVKKTIIRYKPNLNEWHLVSNQAPNLISFYNNENKFLGARNDFVSSELIYSIDEGKSWTIIDTPTSSIINKVRIAKNNPLVIAYSTSTGLYLSQNGGSTFSQIYDQQAGDFIFNDQDSNHIIMSNGYGLYESSDSGASWTFVGSNINLLLNSSPGDILSLSTHYVFANTLGGLYRLDLNNSQTPIEPVTPTDPGSVVNPESNQNGNTNNSNASASSLIVILIFFLGLLRKKVNI